ncbi:hypothetical protein LJC00_04425 [Dysgonomonas sp. OttesenSCG-928-M03]|nr:hypothetical protein [Dysgonomonas sp. OttesenSCG-928-M03]
MEDVNKNNIEDKQLRKILSETRMTASDNLRFRIMQQIETEKALSRQKSKQSFSVLKNMLSVFGVMYAIIAIVGLGIYTMYGKDGIESTSTYLIVILIASVCSMFWMISVFDEKRRHDKHNKHQ